jgi:hypothetical protein
MSASAVHLRLPVSSFDTAAPESGIMAREPDFAARASGVTLDTSAGIGATTA